MSPISSKLSHQTSRNGLPKLVEISKASFSTLRGILDIPTSDPLDITLETHQHKLRSNRIKLFDGLAAVGLHCGMLYAVATCDAVLLAQALGGRFVRLELQPHVVERVVIGGVDLFCLATVRASTNQCGPIFCASSRQAQQLHESKWPALKASEKWCAPITERNRLVCAKCNETFSSERALWEHGGVPREQREKLVVTVPSNWRPIPVGRSRSPVPSDNMSSGSLVDRRYGDRHQHYLKAKLMKLASVSSMRHHPYRIPLRRPSR